MKGAILTELQTCLARQVNKNAAGKKTAFTRNKIFVPTDYASPGSAQAEQNLRNEESDLSLKKFIKVKKDEKRSSLLLNPLKTYRIYILTHIPCP